MSNPNNLWLAIKWSLYPDFSSTSPGCRVCSSV